MSEINQNPEGVALGAESQEEQIEKRLRNDVRDLKNTTKYIKKDTRLLTQIEKAIKKSLDKKEKIRLKWNIRIQRARKLGDPEKYVTNLQKKMDKKLNRVTKSDLKDINDMIQGLEMGSLAQKFSDIEKRIGAEIQRIAQDEAYEIKAYHKAFSWIRQSKAAASEKMKDYGSKAGNFAKGKLKGSFNRFFGRA